ncbi:MAG: ThuA domain-containing protein, partial [Verrucomicrobia bacterium]|nr:ThuA domain-containing protein [Verrucomicrobiota bacterium]
AETPRTFRVCLVSGANESKPYSTDTSLRALADYLQTEHKMICDVLVVNAAGTGFDGVERLLDADAAVFFVRRKKLDEHNLAVIRRFFASGKGVIALRSTSHAWLDWPDFDAEVLGAKYGRNGTGNFGDAERLLFRPHPIWEGVVNPTKIGVALTTRRDLYRYTDMAPDITVILEGETKNGRMPVAWTRVHSETRIFHVALGYADEMESPAYRQMVRNAVYWVTNTKPPAPKAPPKKTED